jgi:DNA-binding GntR family transcriptional regulator
VRNTTTTPVRARVKLSAWERAYEQIKEMILTLKIKPGETVSELGLAQQTGTSRTPVREAIRKLEQEGLIESTNHRKRVYVLRIHEVDEIFDLKQSIESAIARYAAERKTTGHDREMKAILESMKKFSGRDLSVASGDHSLIHEWLRYDRAFHALIFAMAGNKRAEQIIDTLNDQWHRLESGLLAMEGRIAQNIGEHLEIGTAIMHGDGKRAEHLMHSHLSRLHVTITKIMEVFHYPD